MLGASQEAGPWDAGTAVVVLTPPHMMYVPDPVTFTQIWVAKTASMGAAEFSKESDLYCDGLMENLVEYVTIITFPWATAKFMLLLRVLSGDQLCRVHLIGRFRCGIRKHTPPHNRIFGLLGGKLVYQLPPISMVPEACLVPWFQTEELFHTISADIAILEMSH